MVRKVTIKTETPRLKKALGKPSKHRFFAKAKALQLLTHSKTISHVMILNEVVTSEAFVKAEKMIDIIFK